MPRWVFSFRYLSLGIAFTTFFITPSFMCNGGKRMPLGLTKGLFLTFLWPGVSGSHFLCTVIFSVPTVPFANETANFWTTQLHLYLCIIFFMIFFQKKVSYFRKPLSVRAMSSRNCKKFPLCSSTAFKQVFEESLNNRQWFGSY